MNRLRQFFTPPIFPEDDEKTLQARILHTLVVNLGGIIIFAITVGNAFIFAEKFYTTIVLIVTLGIVFLTSWCLNKGYVREGNLLIVIMFWLVATGLAFISGGIRSYHASLYLSGIVIAGLLLGLSGSLVFGIGALSSGLIMILLDNAGFKFPTLFTYPSGSIWIILAVNIAAILLPLSVTLRSLASALARARHELADRQRAEEIARRRVDEMALLYQLGLSVAAGKDLYATLYAIQQQLMHLIQADAFYVAIYDEATDIVNYPIFFSAGIPLSDRSRKLADEPGLTGAVIFNRKTLYLPDILTGAVEQAYHPVDNNDLILHTFLGVPLIIDERVIGMLSVQSNRIDAYNADQIKLVEALAAQAVIAIEKARLFEQLQSELVERKLAELAVREERDHLARRRETMEKISELGKAVAQETDMKDCLRAAHLAIQKGLGFDRVGLSLYDAQTDMVQSAYGTNRRGEVVDNFWLKQPASKFSSWSNPLRDPGGMIFIDDLQALRQFKPADDMYGVKQQVILAAWAGDVPVALISVDNLLTQREITPEQIEALRLLAGYIGLSIKNAALNDDLERRVHERTAQLEAAISELDSFSFSVAHDLRAPLRGMRGFSQIMLEEYNSVLDERAHNHLLRIAGSAKQMGELIDALLDFSRLTRIELKREKVNLSALAHDILAGLQRAETRRQVHFEIADDITALADRRLTRVVLEHLLGNAWKFTAKKAEATIAFGMEMQNGTPVFFVGDNGAGFNMEYAGKLFGAFQRLHHPDEFPGHGAGLAIVQRIVKKHGGRIWAEGAVERGATFYFTLG